MHAQAGSTAAELAALRSLGLRGAALAEVGAALEDAQAEALVYARAHVDTDVVWSQTVLNLRDTASGRVALFRLNPPPGSQQQWMAIAPATPAQPAARAHDGTSAVSGCEPGAKSRTNGLRERTLALPTPQQSVLDEYRTGVVQREFCPRIGRSNTSHMGEVMTDNSDFMSRYLPPENAGHREHAASAPRNAPRTCRCRMCGYQSPARATVTADAATRLRSSSPPRRG